MLSLLVLALPQCALTMRPEMVKLVDIARDQRDRKHLADPTVMPSAARVRRLPSSAAAKRFDNRTEGADRIAKLGVAAVGMSGEGYSRDSEQLPDPRLEPSAAGARPLSSLAAAETIENRMVEFVDIARDQRDRKQLPDATVEPSAARARPPSSLAAAEPIENRTTVAVAGPFGDRADKTSKLFFARSPQLWQEAANTLEHSLGGGVAPERSPCQTDASGRRTGCKRDCSCRRWEACFRSVRSSEEPSKNLGICEVSTVLLCLVSCAILVGLLIATVLCHIALRRRDMARAEREATLFLNSGLCASGDSLAAIMQKRAALRAQFAQSRG